MKKLIFFLSVVSFFSLSCVREIIKPVYIYKTEEEKRLAIRLGMSDSIYSNDFVLIAGLGDSQMQKYHIGDVGLDSIRTDGVSFWNLTGILPDLSNYAKPSKVRQIDNYFLDQTMGHLVGPLPLFAHSLKAQYSNHDFGFVQFSKSGTSMATNTSNWAPGTNGSLFSKAVSEIDNFIIHQGRVPKKMIIEFCMGENDIASVGLADAFYGQMKKTIDSLISLYPIAKIIVPQMDPYYQHNVRYISVSNAIFKIDSAYEQVETISYMNKNLQPLGDFHAFYINGGALDPHKTIPGLKSDNDSMMVKVATVLE